MLVHTQLESQTIILCGVLRRVFGLPTEGKGTRKVTVESGGNKLK